jgi:DNA-binding CsgD family transcriptional regulator
MHDVLAGLDFHAERRDNSDIPVLTNREHEVLCWLGIGKSNGEIAEILGTSPNTVKNQVRVIFDKLRVRNRTQAAGIAVQMGIVPSQNAM